MAAQAIAERSDLGPDGAVEALSGTTEPVVLRGLAADWPVVAAAKTSDASLRDYLLGFYQGAPVTAFLGPPEVEGRIFYTDDLSATNFEQVRIPLDDVLGRLLEQVDAKAPPTIYMGSMAMDFCLPGIARDNSLPFGERKATVRIWIGNRSRVAAHFDVLDNIACVVAGRRRFTLFPPEQLPNLYVGPIDFTPAGQSVSLVDVDAPDLERFPRYAEAAATARSVVLEPGDALYVPSMWWHHVRGLEPVNALINHWWRDVPAWMGAPGDALMHAILALRDLPAAQREAWAGLFRHYVFEYDARSFEHIPDARRGLTGVLDEDSARRLRSQLREKLNR